MIRNELDNYFMRPQFLEGIGNIYPIKIADYERFRELASKYIVQGIKTLHNLYKVPKDTNELDYFIKIGIEMDKQMEYLEKIQGYKAQNEDEQKKLNEMNELYQKYQSGNILIYSIKELEELFSLILKKEVKFNYSSDSLLEYSFDVMGENLSITKENFKELVEIVRWQNILYEMPSSENERLNQSIQKAIKIYSRDNSGGGDLCAMLSAVGIERNLSDEQIFNYTYYRLCYDYAIISRKSSNLFAFMLRSQGCSDASITDLSEKVNLHFDPYDMILNKNINNSLEERLKK